MSSPHNQSSASDCASRNQASRPRKVAAWLIRGAGLLLGVAMVSFYVLIVWESPPDMSNASPRSVFNFYVTGPLLLFFGPILLAGWIASRVDYRTLTD
jgi:hypothetical protein